MTLYPRKQSAAFFGLAGIIIAAATLLAFGWGSDAPTQSAAEATAVRPREWQQRWDPEVGLWWQELPGHTKPARDRARTHPAPSAAARLLLAAQARQLSKLNVTAVLQAFRRMQMLKGSGAKGHGELRWYWEEAGPVDHNGSFFTAMSLITLYVGHADQLSEAQRAAMLEIFRDLRVWFVAQAEDRDFLYPNRYLGDLVCAWLLGEITGVDDAGGRLRQTMLDAADYWATQGWGWGEHMSDIYAGICLDELSALLLFSQRLPRDVRRAYKSLFDNLLALDDAFGDQPRVPAIRTYAFTETPMRIRYRDTIRPLPKSGEPLAPPATPVMPPEVGGVFRHRPPLGATLHARGWAKLAPPPRLVSTRVLVPCHGGVVATAHIEPDVRLGSLSRFPLMSNVDQPKWGMSWQSAPVALLRREGDWGFLQWETQEGDRVRAHPANDIVTSYSDNALCADDAVTVVGRTFSLQRGGDVIVIRQMPRIASSWDQLIDRLRIVNPRVSPATSSAPFGNHRLELRYPQRTIGVQCIPLSAGGRVDHDESIGAAGERIVDWGVVFDGEALASLDTVTVIWGISINGPIDARPRLLRLAPARGSSTDPASQPPLDVQWEWPGTTWHVRFDPQAEEPLQDLAPPPSTSPATTRAPTPLPPPSPRSTGARESGF